MTTVAAALVEQLVSPRDAVKMAVLASGEGTDFDTKADAHLAAEKALSDLGHCEALATSRIPARRSESVAGSFGLSAFSAVTKSQAFCGEQLVELGGGAAWAAAAASASSVPPATSRFRTIAC